MKQGFWQREWMEILRQYGTPVTVFDRREGEGRTGWALQISSRRMVASRTTTGSTICGSISGR